MADWISTPGSSHVSAIRYEPDTQDCFVRFNDGTVYRYMDVPQKVFNELEGHTSKGRYINIVLRRQYRYEKV
jgi:hypothetical protein